MAESSVLETATIRKLLEALLNEIKVGKAERYDAKEIIIRRISTGFSQ
jgi:hypothetical protein